MVCGVRAACAFSLRFEVSACVGRGYVTVHRSLSLGSMRFHHFALLGIPVVFVAFYCELYIAVSSLVILAAAVCLSA